MVEATDRRADTPQQSSSLKPQLNEAQQATLERFGWQLKFIRHPPGQLPLVVLQDPDTGKFAVLDEEGELDENPIWQTFRS